MIDIVNCNSWLEFKTYLHELLYEEEHSLSNKFLFRGQGDAEWRITSHFDRAFEESSESEKDMLESELMINFKKECEGRDELKDLMTDDLAVTALAQHFGLPTRLVDWSESPFVAAFFAFQGHFQAVISEDEVSSDVSIIALNRDSYIWSDKKGVSIISPETWENERQRNQFGWFSLSNTPFKNLESYVESFGEQDQEDALIKIIVPASEATIAVNDLKLMGIKHSTLFPGLDGIAKAALTNTLLSRK